MILNRLVASPETRRVLRLHLAASPFVAVLWATLVMIPVILRKHLDAVEWEITIVTSAVPVLLGLSILWNEVYRRISPGRYLLATWVLTLVPLAAIAVCQRSETVLICVALSAAGIAGGNPIAGDILRSCYPASARSRIFGTLNATTIDILGGVGKNLQLTKQMDGTTVNVTGACRMARLGGMTNSRSVVRP